MHQSISSNFKGLELVDSKCSSTICNYSIETDYFLNKAITLMSPKLKDSNLVLSLVTTILSIFQDNKNQVLSNNGANGQCLNPKEHQSDIYTSTLNNNKQRTDKTYRQQLGKERKIYSYISGLMNKCQIQDPRNYNVPINNNVDNLEVLFYVFHEQLKREQNNLLTSPQPNKLTTEWEGSKTYCATLQETNALTFEMVESNMNARSEFSKLFIQALAIDLDLNEGQINIISIKKGSIKVVFQIVDATGAIHVNAELKQLQAQFPGSVPVLKIHQLFAMTKLNVADFDPQFNKEWVGLGSTVRGPQNNTLIYNYPNGWKGYSLKVSGFYGQNDNWLAKNQNTEEWYVLFHGTSADALNPIMTQRKQGGLKPGPGQGCAASKCQKTQQIIGNGVYFGSRMDIYESYAKSKLSQIKVGNKSYLVVLQSRVNPIKLKYCGNDTYVINESCDIRPYRILLKQT